MGNKLKQEIDNAKKDLKKSTIDEKTLKKAWKITGDIRNLTEEKIETLKTICLKILDKCPHIIFKTDLHRLIGMKSSTFYAAVMSDVSFKEEVEWRLARNNALETIRVLEALAKSTHINALVIRLKMVSKEARDLLNFGYISKEEERKEIMSRKQKLEEIGKLTKSLGNDLRRMIKIKGDDDSDGQSSQ